jgi:3-hydroxyisobutyrate dehydrogenase-like beta-hydroxyacid dehydrogenase
MKVGFIGLGQMGSAMAANLIRRGHEVTLWNRSLDKAAGLVAAGAKLASSPAAAAQGDVVMTMLADDAAVEAVVYGDKGILEQPALHISQSTISVDLADRLARSHGADAFVSAPVFGRPPAAQAGMLFVIAAGQNAALEAATPALEAISQSIFRVGSSPSQANLVKLGGNFMIVAAIEAFAEAMTLVESGNVSRRDFYEVITRTIFNFPVLRTYGELLVTEAFQPAGFPATLGLKDMNLVDAVAGERQVPMPVLGVMRDHLRSVIATEGTELDLAAMGLAVRRSANR